MRVIKPGGILEIHTVNAAPLMRAMLDWEETGETDINIGSWRVDLHKQHPFLWSSGRIICYPKRGSGEINVHRAILTPRYLRECLEAAGISEIKEVAEPRGVKKHAAINMGFRGVKC